MKIEKIVLNIKEEKVELSVDEARELYGELYQLFGQHQYVPYYPPVIIREYPKIDYPYSQPSITWGTGAITTGTNDSLTNKEVPFTYTN